MKLIDTESQLKKAHNQIKTSTQQVNQLINDKETIQADLHQQLEEASRQNQELKDQVNREISDKKDFEALCIDFQSQNKKMIESNKKLEQELNKKEFSMSDKTREVDFLNASLTEQKTKLKKTDLKLRQVQFTQVKDLQRLVQQKDIQIKELHQKIESFLNHSYSPGLVRPMSFNKRQSDSMANFSSVPSANASYANPRTRIQSSRMRGQIRGIQEVDENLEKSGRNFHQDNERSFRTPQKLPSIYRNAAENSHKSRDMAVRDKMHEVGIKNNPRSVSSEQYSELTAALKNKKMLNNSNNVAALFSGDNSGSQARLPGKLEQ